MKTIWKFPLHKVALQSLSMPKGAKILTLQVQNDQPCIWALVDEDHRKELKEFLTFGTGHQLPEKLGPYVGSYQIHDGWLVFHVFEGAQE